MSGEAGRQQEFDVEPRVTQSVALKTNCSDAPRNNYFSEHNIGNGSNYLTPGPCAHTFSSNRL